MLYNSTSDQWYSPYETFTYMSTLADASPVHGYQTGDYVSTDIGGDFTTATAQEYAARVSYSTNYLSLAIFDTYASGSNASSTFISTKNSPAPGDTTIESEYNTGSQNVYPHYVDWQPLWTWDHTGSATYYWDQTPIAGETEWAAFWVNTPGSNEPTGATVLYGPSSSPIYLTTDPASHANQGVVHRPPANSASNGNIPVIFENRAGKVLAQYSAQYVQTHHQEIEQQLQMKF